MLQFGNREPRPVLFRGKRHDRKAATMGRKLSKAKFSETIVKHGYTVQILSPNVAIVSGGFREDGSPILSQPFRISKLLGEGDANPKTEKNDVPTMGLSLYPETGAGIGNVCPFATVCVKPCLAHQGQGPVPNVAGPRVAKTVLWFLARDWFLAKLRRELENFRKRESADIIGVRLNMFSDIPWEYYGIIENFPGIMFYDYTKNPRRVGMIRPNYWITFSYDGTNDKHAENVLRNGGNVSVVFYNEPSTLLAEHGSAAACGKAAHRQVLPKSWRGFPAIDGGKTDWRPDDPRGVVIGLRLLARTYDSRNDAIESGFAQLHTPEFAVA